MHLAKKTILLAVVAILALLLSRYAGPLLVGEAIGRSDLPAPQGAGSGDWKDLIVSSDERDRILGHRVALENRRETLRFLLFVVNGPVKQGEEFYASTTARNLAITLLGQLRAPEAVNDLLAWLSPKPGQVAIIDAPIVLSPAGYALVDTGLPSIPALVGFLRSDACLPVLSECVKVIGAIKGMPESELLFEKIIAKETDAPSKKRLQDAQNVLRDPKIRALVERLHESRYGFERK